jgi:hypothetical protein
MVYDFSYQWINDYISRSSPEKVNWKYPLNFLCAVESASSWSSLRTRTILFLIMTGVFTLFPCGDSPIVIATKSVQHKGLSVVHPHKASLALSSSSSTIIELISACCSVLICTLNLYSNLLPFQEYPSMWPTKCWYPLPSAPTVFIHLSSLGLPSNVFPRTFREIAQYRSLHSANSKKSIPNPDSPNKAKDCVI